MPEYNITVDIPDDEVADLIAQVEFDPNYANPERHPRACSKAAARLRAALLKAATPPPVTSITLNCLTGHSPNMLLQISEDDCAELYVNIGGKSVLVPFDAVIDAVTQLRDTAQAMQP